jgi:hypothetical protein
MHRKYTRALVPISLQCLRPCVADARSCILDFPLSFASKHSSASGKVFHSHSPNAMQPKLYQGREQG